MNLHLRTASILVAILLLTGATESVKSVSMAQTSDGYSVENVKKESPKKEVSKVVSEEDEYYIKELSDKVSKKKQKIVYNLASQYEIDPLLIYSIMCVESGFNEKCESETNDKGICQINVSNLKYLEKTLGRDIDLFNFTDNVESCCVILLNCYDAWKKYEKIDGEKWMYLAVNSYNAGCSSINKHYVKTRGKNIKTRSYGDMVVSTYNEYLDGNFDYQPRD